jgi:hypothetical protein
VRAGVVAVFTVLPGVLLLLFGKQFGMYRLAGAVPIGVWLWMYVFEYFRGARAMDDAGVTRRDGRWYVWADLKEMRFGRARLPSGERGALNHVDLVFPRGKVRLFPFTIENVGEVLRFIERLKRTPGVVIKPPEETPPAAKTIEKTGPVAASPAVPKPCGTCGELGEYHRGFQKGGREEEDTFLPAASSRLKNVAETKPGQNRSPVVQRCPECGAYFLYEVEYDFLVGGSEDTQYLSRLTPEQAEKLLKRDEH